MYTYRYIPDRPTPTSIPNTQKTDLFLNPSLSKMVGSRRRARMSVNAVIDKQDAISTLLIPIDHQVPSKSLPKSQKLPHSGTKLEKTRQTIGKSIVVYFAVYFLYITHIHVPGINLCRHQSLDTISTNRCQKTLCQFYL